MEKSNYRTTYIASDSDDEKTLKIISEMCSLTSRLSTVNSEDYKVWKSETLAKQSYQLEPAQTTGIWNQSMVECEVGEDLRT